VIYLAYLLLLVVSGLINTVVLTLLQTLCALLLFFLPPRIQPHVRGLVAGFIATVLLALILRWIFSAVAGPHHYGLAAFLTGLLVPAFQALQDHGKALKAFTSLEGPDLTLEQRESNRQVLAAIKGSGMPTVGSTLLVMVGQLAGAWWFWQNWA
jgi:hypothetical protein